MLKWTKRSVFNKKGGNWNTMDDVYNNIDDYNQNKNRKILIVFDDLIADIMTNKKFKP